MKHSGTDADNLINEQLGKEILGKKYAPTIYARALEESMQRGVSIDQMYFVLRKEELLKAMGPAEIEKKHDRLDQRQVDSYKRQLYGAGSRKIIRYSEKTTSRTSY